MTNFVSFTEGGEVSHVDHLVFNLVDPAADTGSVTSLISKSLKGLATGVAARFDSDPLIDYRAQRPLMNFRNGRLVGLVDALLMYQAAKAAPVDARDVLRAYLKGLS